MYEEELEPIECSDCLSEPCTNDTGRAYDLDGWEESEFGYKCPECCVKHTSPNENAGIEGVTDITGAGGISLLAGAILENKKDDEEGE